jgi:CheY-like chemotaxis protein
MISAMQRAPYRILVVDDVADQAQSFSYVLEASGHRAEFVTDPRNATIAALSFNPDLVFLDINMPYLDGYQLIALLREVLGRRVPIVALTAYGAAEDRERTRKAGFDAHVLKAEHPELLEATVLTLLGGRSRAASN